MFWTLIFAIGCFSASLYACLAGTIPFAIAAGSLMLEGIWGIVALRKWLKRISESSEFFEMPYHD